MDRPAHFAEFPADAHLEHLILDLELDLRDFLELVWLLEQDSLREMFVFNERDEGVSELEDFLREIVPIFRHLVNHDLQEELQGHHHRGTVSDDEGEVGVGVEEESLEVSVTISVIEEVGEDDYEEEAEEEEVVVDDYEVEVEIDEDDYEVEVEIDEDDYEEEEVEIDEDGYEEEAEEEEEVGELVGASRDSCDNSLGGTSTCQVGSELDPAPSTSGTRKRTREEGAEEEPPAKRISHDEEEEVDVVGLPDEPEIISISSTDEILEISSGLSGYDASSEDEEDEDEDDLPLHLRFVQRIPLNFRFPWLYDLPEE